MDYGNPYYPFDTYREWKDVEDIKNIKVPFGAKLSYFADQHPIFLAVIGVGTVLGVAGTYFFGKAEKEVQEKIGHEEDVGTLNVHDYIDVYYTITIQKRLPQFLDQPQEVIDLNNAIIKEVLEKEPFPNIDPTKFDHQLFLRCMDFHFGEDQEKMDAIFKNYKERNGIA